MRSVLPGPPQSASGAAEAFAAREAAACQVRVSYGLPVAAYPYILVRLICRRCERRGNYRLAELADRYGSEIALSDLLKLLADCPYWDARFILTDEFCGAYFPDLSGSDPPDLPPRQLLLKIVK